MFWLNSKLFHVTSLPLGCGLSLSLLLPFSVLPSCRPPPCWGGTTSLRGTSSPHCCLWGKPPHLGQVLDRSAPSNVLLSGESYRRSSLPRWKKWNILIYLFLSAVSSNILPNENESIVSLKSVSLSLIFTFCWGYLVVAFWLSSHIHRHPIISGRSVTKLGSNFGIRDAKNSWPNVSLQIFLGIKWWS